jgi:formate hydrogenlyase subunit 4
MIHEAMVLEYSGRHLALIEWAKMMKLLLFMALGSAVFLPWGIAAESGASALAFGMAALVAKLAGAGVVLVLVETGLAKMRIFRVTEFLGSSFLLATLGMLSFFILE